MLAGNRSGASDSELFGMLVANELNQLTPRSRRKVKNDVQSTLYYQIERVEQEKATSLERDAEFEISNENINSNSNQQE